MSEETNQKTPEFAIAQAGGVAVEEAIAMLRAAEMLEVPVETLLDGVYTPIYAEASHKSALGLKRMAAICLILYEDKSKEEREGRENNGLHQ